MKTFIRLVFAMLLVSCESYGPFHPNTAAEPLNSIRGPSDGRYKFAFIEFGDQGSALDTSQRAVAINAIRQAQRPLLFVYIHGWMNNANSGDVCRFEHFIDMVSRLPEVTRGKINVIGVYIGWRGKDLTVPGLDLLTFWNRKLTGGSVAAQNSCLATINELALAAREPGKQVHHCGPDGPLVWRTGPEQHYFSFHPRCQQHGRAQRESLGHGGGIQPCG